MPAKTTKVIRVRALRVVQDAAHPLFLFTLSSSELFDVADVSRVSRDDTGKLIGYQRAEVRRHVRDIVDYLDSKEVLFPNPIPYQNIHSSPIPPSRSRHYVLF